MTSFNLILQPLTSPKSSLSCVIVTFLFYYYFFQFRVKFPFSRRKKNCISKICGKKVNFPGKSHYNVRIAPNAFASLEWSKKC